MRSGFAGLKGVVPPLLASLGGRWRLPRDPSVRAGLARVECGLGSSRFARLGGDWTVRVTILVGRGRHASTADEQRREHEYERDYYRRLGLI